MATQSTVDFADQITKSLILDQDLIDANTELAESQLTPDPLSSSAYTMACDQSMLSGNVDRWIHGYSQDTGVQDSRVPRSQYSRLAPPSTSMEANGLWYMLALIIPLFSLQSTWQWRCTPSAVLNSAELLLNRLSMFCHDARTHIRRLARDQMTRDVFATAMDIVLVVYAMGFLVLSLCQATLIH